MDDGWCKCGLALEDPLHYSFHAIKVWNDGVYRDAREKSMRDFDRMIEKDKKNAKERKWKSLDI